MGFVFGSIWTMTVFSLRKAWRNISGRRQNKETLAQNIGSCEATQNKTTSSIAPNHDEKQRLISLTIEELKKTSLFDECNPDHLQLVNHYLTYGMFDGMWISVRGRNDYALDVYERRVLDVHQTTYNQDVVIYEIINYCISALAEKDSKIPKGLNELGNECFGMDRVKYENIRKTAFAAIGGVYLDWFTQKIDFLWQDTPFTNEKRKNAREKDRIIREQDMASALEWMNDFRDEYETYCRHIEDAKKRGSPNPISHEQALYVENYLDRVDDNCATLDSISILFIVEAVTRDQNELDEFLYQEALDSIIYVNTYIDEIPLPQEEKQELLNLASKMEAKLPKGNIIN